MEKKLYHASVVFEAAAELYAVSIEFAAEF
jgi:hypothetical protein